MNDERMSTASVELALRDLVDHPTGVLTAVGQECVMRDLLDARAQEESWKILANKANERADYFERERDEARKALARFPTLIEITGALVPGANPGLTARLIADYNSAEIARAAGGGEDE